MTKRDRVRELLLKNLADRHSDPDLLPTTLRFVFYELEQDGDAQKPTPGGTRRSTGWPPGSQDITDAATSLRNEGAIPWDTFADTERSLSVFRHAPTVAEYLIDTLPLARINPWHPFPPPLILTESNGMALVLERLAGEYACPIAGTKGFSNGFIRTAIAPMMQVDDEKNGVVRHRSVLYLGDYDRSGLKIEANSEKVLRSTGWIGQWTRIGLTDDQVKVMRASGRTPIVKTDRRDSKTAEAWEVESLGQRAVLHLVRTVLEKIVPEPLTDVQEREERERDDATETLTEEQETA
jgi:hypothetical protein